MARPIRKEEEAKKKPVVVEVKPLEKPAPPPTPAPQRPFSLAPVANAFDLLDEDSSDLISIVDAKEDDAFVAAERKRIEEEKKAVREAKMKAMVEERKAKKRAIQEQERKKKAYEASILGFHGQSARPSPNFSRGPTGGIPKPSSDSLQPQLAQSLSALELQVKGRGAVVEEEAASVDGSSSKSSGGSGRPNVNGSLLRKQKKKKAAAGEKKEGEDQPSGNIAAAAVAAPVGNNNYPRSYTLKEYEERKKREEDEKHKKFNAINNGMDHRSRSFDNEGQRFDGTRFDNGGHRKIDNGGHRRIDNGGQKRFENGGQRFDKQQAPAEKALVQSDASFSLEDAEFPVLAKQAPAVKAVVEKAPSGKAVAKKASAKKA